MNSIQSTPCATWWCRAILAILLLYSLVHFAESGVLVPLSRPSLGQIEEEVSPLRRHLRDGLPVTTNNPRQYGPVFFFVMHPLLRVAADDPERLSRLLYGLQIVCLSLSFVFSWAAFGPVVAPERRWIALGGLAVLWANFAPIYMILAVKNVETWELLLICAALLLRFSLRRVDAAGRDVVARAARAGLAYL